MSKVRITFTFPAKLKQTFSCTTCGARRFKPCVRLGGYGIGTAPHRYYCHVARHNKALASFAQTSFFKHTNNMIRRSQS